MELTTILCILLLSLYLLLAVFWIWNWCGRPFKWTVDLAPN